MVGAVSTVKVPFKVVFETAATVMLSPLENPCATDVVIVTAFDVLATLVIVLDGLDTLSKDRSVASNRNSFVTPPAKTAVTPVAEVRAATTLFRFSDAAAE